eukprot:s2027_g4.t2
MRLSVRRFHAHRVLCLAGDGVGGELLAATKLALQATGVSFSFEDMDFGNACARRTGIPINEDHLQAVEEIGCVLKGPIDIPAGGASSHVELRGQRFSSANQALRKLFQLYANVRPAKYLEGAAYFLSRMSLFRLMEPIHGTTVILGSLLWTPSRGRWPDRSPSRTEGRPEPSSGQPATAQDSLSRDAQPTWQSQPPGLLNSGLGSNGCLRLLKGGRQEYQYLLLCLQGVPGPAVMPPGWPSGVQAHFPVPVAPGAAQGWAQRLLNRAGLSRRDRLDVFYSAGGSYNSAAIERALRHRCSHVHEEERRLPSLSRPVRSSRAPSSAASSVSASTSASSFRSRGTRKHGVHVAEHPDEEEDEENIDVEDLEQEEQDQGGPLVDDECLGAAEPDAGLDQDSQEETDVFEAFQAGWKAKMKAGEKRKARGYRVVPAGSAKSGVASSGGKSLALKKKSSTCASCGGKGHWRGDPECPNVQNGQDALHRPASSTSHSANEVNFVNFTFMVGTLAECPSCGNLR